MIRRTFTAAALACSLAAGSARAEQFFGLTANGQMFYGDTTSPATISAPHVVGVAAGSTISSIDFQPATNTLFGLAVDGTGANGQLYTINPVTGAAVVYGPALTFGGPASTHYTIDFNPAVNAIRIIGNGGGNYRFPITSQILTTDAAIAYAPGDVNSDPNFGPAVVSAAYTPNIGGTTLYTYDFNFSNFARQGSVNGTPTSPNTGQLFSLNQATGSSNLTAASNNVGFDIGTISGSAFASAQVVTGGPSILFGVNLADGTSTPLGALGNLNVADIALPISPITVPEPSTCALVGAGVLLALAAVRRRTA